MTSELKAPLRFLVIQLRQVGDVLISTTLCETLKTNFPDSQVDYAVYPYTAGLAENNPFIDNLWIIPNGFSIKKTGQLLHVLRKIRHQHYDYAIEILNTPKSIWLARLSGAKTIIGQNSEKKRTRHYDIKVNYSNDFLAHDGACHSVKNRLCLLQPLSDQINYCTRYKVHLKDDEKRQAHQTLLQANISTDRPLFFFSLGTRSPSTKQWPLDNFINVINHCQKTLKAHIIVCPTAMEKNDADYVKSRVHMKDDFFILCDTNLRELAAIINSCDIFVGNDSGPQHIAYAVDTPSVSICSPSIYFSDWRPSNDPRHISVNIQDILNLTDQEYEALLTNQSAEQTKELYQHITPSIVSNAVEKLYASTANDTKRQTC